VEEEPSFFCEQKPRVIQKRQTRTRSSEAGGRTAVGAQQPAFLYSHIPRRNKTSLTEVWRGDQHGLVVELQQTQP